MKLCYSTLFAALFVLGMDPTVVAAEKPSCTDYTKGEFEAQTISTKEICESACQTAEGLPVGRFSTEEGNPDYVKCTCIRENNQGTTETRDLCMDGAPSGGAMPTTLAAVVATALVVLASM